MKNAQNNFLAFANRSMSWAVKRQLHTEGKHVLRRAQKKAVVKALHERDLLMRLWKKWRKELVHAALDGPYQKDIEALINFLNRMKLPDEPQLIKVMHAGPWLGAHKDIQFLVLRLIDARLTILRERQGLPPFDDALWGEPLTAFQIIRNRFLEKTHAA